MRAIVNNKNTFALLVSVCLIGLTAERGVCRTIMVRVDGSGDYPTIQVAIDNAVDGDEVVLEPGTYTGPGNRNLNFKGKAVRVRSIHPNDNKSMRFMFGL